MDGSQLQGPVSLLHNGKGGWLSRSVKLDESLLFSAKLRKRGKWGWITWNFWNEIVAGFWGKNLASYLTNCYSHHITRYFRVFAMFVIFDLELVFCVYCADIIVMYFCTKFYSPISFALLVIVFKMKVLSIYILYFLCILHVPPISSPLI
jgi:hypothetical protein